jgi:hypothetical protein
LLGILEAFLRQRYFPLKSPKCHVTCFHGNRKLSVKLWPLWLSTVNFPAKYGFPKVLWLGGWLGGGDALSTDPRLTPSGRLVYHIVKCFNANFKADPGIGSRLCVVYICVVKYCVSFCLKMTEIKSKIYSLNLRLVLNHIPYWILKMSCLFGICFLL